MSPQARSAWWIRVVCIASTLLWIFIVLDNTQLLDKFELGVQDAELQLATSRRSPGDIAIVAFDEKSIHQYGPLPWPAEEMDSVVNAIAAHGAKVIAFDFVFTGERAGRSHAVEQSLASEGPFRHAMAASSNIILGTFFDFAPEPTEFASSPALTELENHRLHQIVYLEGASPSGADPPPIPQAYDVHTVAPGIVSAARSYGHLNLIPDADGIIRWMPLIVRFRDNLYSAFSIEVARAYSGDPPPQVRIARGRVDSLALGNLLITTDEQGEMLIRYAGPRATFPTFSVADLLANKIAADALRGRIVLVGATAAGIGDIWATPFDPLLPGVEIHANAIEDILHGSFLVRNWETRLLTVVAIAFLGTFCAFAIPAFSRRGLKEISLFAAAIFPAIILVHYFFFTRTGYSIGLLSPLFATATLLCGTLMVSYFSEERQRRSIENIFGKYLDSRVIEELVSRPERLRLGGERRDLTVLFCDIRNFTTLSEVLPPESTVDMLNDFFTTMTNIIFASGGMVDKFVGDQIMAVWGAPLARPDHAAAACDAALRMRDAFAKISVKWSATASSRATGPENNPKLAKINCGIGINSGPMVVGNIGSARRLSYTVIGDNVNVASRLESLNKSYGTQLIIGPATYEAARDHFIFREIDRVRVRGRSQSHSIYELLCRADEITVSSEWLRAFADGLAAFRRRDWPIASKHFVAAQNSNPADCCAALYLSRVEGFSKTPPPGDWDGSLELHG
jgi:adenylate cyclase